MLKENVKGNQPQERGFAHEVLDHLYMSNAKELIKTHRDLNEIFVDLMDHTNFHDQDFRERVQWNMEVLRRLSQVIKKYSRKEIDKSIDRTIQLLINDTNETRHGHE